MFFDIGGIIENMKEIKLNNLLDELINENRR